MIILTIVISLTWLFTTSVNAAPFSGWERGWSGSWNWADPWSTIITYTNNSAYSYYWTWSRTVTSTVTGSATTTFGFKQWASAQVGVTVGQTVSDTISVSTTIPPGGRTSVLYRWHGHSYYIEGTYYELGLPIYSASGTFRKPEYIEYMTN